MYVESYVGILAIEIRKNDQETIASLGNKWLGFLVDSDGNGDKEKMIEWGSAWTNTLGDGLRKEQEIEESSVILKSLVSATSIVLFVNETGSSEGRAHPSGGRVGNLLVCLQDT